MNVTEGQLRPHRKGERQSRDGVAMYRRGVVDILDKGEMELPGRRGRPQSRFMDVVMDMV